LIKVLFHQLSQLLPNHKAVVKITHQSCFDDNHSFIVDDLPEAFLFQLLTTTCDDEIDPLVQDGKYPFDTSSFEATI
jgi:hypothetical protein